MLLTILRVVLTWVVDWYRLPLIQWSGLRSWRGMEARGGGRGWDAANVGARSGRGRSALSGASRGATDPVAEDVGRAGRTSRPTQRHRRGSRRRSTLPRRVRPPADLRVTLRRLRELRSSDGRRQSPADCGIRRRRPYGWVVRPLISHESNHAR